MRASQTGTPPNILLITTDQQRFDTIHALGNPHIFTPHLNWLVDEGITYSRCYTDSPICMAARATIMTGLHGYTSGLVGNNEQFRPMSQYPTLPGILTRAGYQTRAQGKMHFSPMRANYGFEHMELPMDYYRERNRNERDGLPKDHGVGENEIEPVISTVHESDSLTQWTVKRSIDFLETRDETRPFFLWTSFTKPHPPFDPCENYWRLYQNREVPDRVLGDWSSDRVNTPQGYLSPTYVLNNAWRMTDAQRRDVVRAYYACITQIDYSLGLLFARMRELGLLENTWILFTADHGDMMGDHGMGEKTVFLEGASHVPLLVRPPNAAWQERPKQAGTCSHRRVDLADIMPTVLSIAGVPIPEGLDGENLLEEMPEDSPDRVFYGNCNHDFFCVMDGNWKYQWTALGGDELLFNLTDDPMEQHNLAALPAHQLTLCRLRGMLIQKGNTLSWDCVKDGKLVFGPAPEGPRSTAKWPGFHSTVFPTDVLH